MKKVLIALLIVILKAGTASAQADSLVRNENNKFIYYQVVSQPASPVDTLYSRALVFLKKAYPKDRLKAAKADKANATLNATGGVLVSKKSLVAMHEDASVGFNFVIEIKADRYRYWFTDFVITPYERDRYANYVPVAGKNQALENGPGKLSDEDYKGYMKKVLVNCREIGAILKSYMINQPTQPKEIKKQTVVPKEW
jgi:hypothetical protein